MRNRSSSIRPRRPTSSSPTTSCAPPGSALNGSASRSASRPSTTSVGTWSRRSRPRSGRRRGRSTTATDIRSFRRHSGRRTSRERRVSEVGERNRLGLSKAERYRILTQYRTIAMVGLSTNYYNASSFAAIYLDANGYDIVPVNPVRAGEEILARPVYADLAAAPEGHLRPIDIVDVFRPADEAPEIAEQAVSIGAKVLWLQLGVISEDAAEIARAGGLDVVMDRCCKIEHAR